MLSSNGSETPGDAMRCAAMRARDRLCVDADGVSSAGWLGGLWRRKTYLKYLVATFVQGNAIP
jgi:hypothetical protein